MLFFSRKWQTWWQDCPQGFGLALREAVEEEEDPKSSSCHPLYFQSLKDEADGLVFLFCLVFCSLFVCCFSVLNNRFLKQHPGEQSDQDH